MTIISDQGNVVTANIGNPLKTLQSFVIIALVIANMHWKFLERTVFFSGTCFKHASQANLNDMPDMLNMLIVVGSSSKSNCQTLVLFDYL